MNKINNTQVDNTKDIDLIIYMYNLLDFSNNYSKTSRSLFQYYKDEPALSNHGAVVDYADNNTTDLFKYKEEITSQTSKDGTKNVGIIVTLKYSHYF